MKIKTFEQLYDESNEDFDSRVNNFINGKLVVQITTDSVVSADNIYVHMLTVIYQ